MDRFVRQKRHAVNKLKLSINVGDADKGIIQLLEAINMLEDYYTTSSCSGRIQLFQDLGSKLKNKTIACWHRKVRYGEVVAAFKTVKGVLYFKCEPPIIHVVARDMEAARRLLVQGRETGFKHSGIQSIRPERFMVELISTESIDAPIADGNKKLVSEDYLQYLTRLANKKYSIAQEKLKKLEKNVKKLRVM